MSSDILSQYSVYRVLLTPDSPLESVQIVDPDTNLIIIDSDTSIDVDIIRTFIESNPSISKVILTSETSRETDEVENFAVSGISYREYAE